MNKKAKHFSTIGDVLAKYKHTDEDKQSLPSHSKSNDASKYLNADKLPSRFSEDKYISQEFQKYGYELAKELSDLKNKSLYIKLAKTTPRGLLESARSFVKDAENVRSPGKLFMWKLSQLKAKKS